MPSLTDYKLLPIPQKRQLNLIIVEYNIIYTVKCVWLQYPKDNSLQTQNILLFNVFPLCSFVHLPTTRNDVINKYI